MILRRVLSGDVGRGPLYAIVQIEFDGTACTACVQELPVGAPALFRVDELGRTTLIHPACRPAR